MSDMGDIFWDLPARVAYAGQADLSCTISVANSSGVEREYSLVTRLSQGTTVLREEALLVDGQEWFSLGPGEFVRLHGSFRLAETNVTLMVKLMDRQTGEIVDRVATELVAPSQIGLDWNSILGMAAGVMVITMVGLMATRALLPGGGK